METDDTRGALLGGLIDHAPTFPPASLPIDEALAEDERAASSPHAFMLARLVWRASALAEVPASSTRAISAVLDAPLVRCDAVEAVEVPPGGHLASIPAVDEVYVETPLEPGFEERLDELHAGGLRAKVRCGGATAPTARELARFVCACRERGLVFKATAGLHHAVRTDGEHGFLNLLAAAVFEDDEEAALGETDAGAFGLDLESFSWRSRSASALEIARVRRELFHSIGSCSFSEPVEELERLGILSP